METCSRPVFSLQSWGANSYGQLGQGHVEDQSDPRLSDAAALHNKTVRAVSGGGGHTVLLTENGEVFVCGQNNRGQLGLGHNADILTLQLCSSLSQKVTKVACGWDFTLLLTDCGRVLACGSNAFGQLGVGQTVTHSAGLQVVESLKEPVVSVAAGLRHSLAVTDSGCVYQWGKGLFSQAKRALSPHPVPSHLSSMVPSLVPGLNQKTSCMVTAGSAHCVCLTGDGDLFLWGSNKHGQLTAAEPFLSSPTPVKRSLLGGEKVVHVWSGWTHIVAQTGVFRGWSGLTKAIQLHELMNRSIFGLMEVSHLKSLSDAKVAKIHFAADSVLSSTLLSSLRQFFCYFSKLGECLRSFTVETGRVFTWGRGDYGQLGRQASTSQNPEQQSVQPSAAGGNREARSPAEIEVLRGATQIACGSEHNLAIVGGCLLSWGWNEHGMCGDGSQTDVFQPQLISGLRPLLIGCGAGHSMAVCTATTDSRQNSAPSPL